MAPQAKGPRGYGFMLGFAFPAAGRRERNSGEILLLAYLEYWRKTTSPAKSLCTAQAISGPLT
jgi:hypothetical protein